MKICIDAGHGGRDPGAVNGARQEKNDALRMALALRDVMQSRGHTVAMTRTGDTWPTYAERVSLANGFGADVYVSLHRNSAATATATGLEVLYRTVTDKTATNNAASMQLAVELDRRAVIASGFRDRGAKVQNTNTYVLQHTKMPAVTVEAGFVSTAADNMQFDATFDALIAALADGLEAQFGKGTAVMQPEEDAAEGTVTVPAFFVNGGIVKLTTPYTTGTNAFWTQDRLIRHWAMVGQRDGIYGPKTAQGVKLFQAARKAEGRDIGAVDGIVGPKTAAILAE